MSSHAVARPRRPGVPAVIGAEVGKGLRVQLAHPAGHVISLLLGMTMFLGVQFVMGQGELREDLFPPMLVAVGGFWFLNSAGLVMVSDLIEEKRTGTFAQSQMSPAPPWAAMLGRLITAALFGLVVAAAASLVPALVGDVTVPLRWAALVPYALLLLNVLAFTFLLATIALVSPMIGALQSLLTSLVLLLNGAFLPLALYPDWLALVARFLPTTLTIEATNDVLFRGRSLGDLWAAGTLPWASAYTLALVVLSGALFVRNHRRAVRDGRLGQY
jgi:ABC-2 type transport system permease protein